LYPKDEYFKYEELDFVMAGEMTPEKLKRVEEYLVKDPNNFKAQAGYGEIVFDMLNPKDESTPLPENAADLEKKMDAAFRKATELSPASGFSMSNLANHYFNRAMRADRELSAHRKMMGEKATAARKNAPPPPKGKPAPEFKHSPEDIARRDELVASKYAYYDKAAECYDKAIDIYSKVAAPTTMEKQQYKNAVSYMIDIYKDKKETAQKATPPNTADAKKYEALEKKYADLYHKLSS
jgi:tetratricopeptide (TPR) repeat protein